MQLINLTLLSFATSILAAPQGSCSSIQPPKKNDKFGLIAIHSASPIQNVGITASKGHLAIGGRQKDASCDTPSSSATFYIKDKQAYLYSTSATPQQLWVDRSGMGQGVMGYTTGAQLVSRHAERKGFEVDKQGNLVFDGISPKACPPGKGHEKDGWGIWWSSAEKPGFNEGCISVTLSAVKADQPVGCEYSSS